jgi:hypothetical protein
MDFKLDQNSAKTIANVLGNLPTQTRALPLFDKVVNQVQTQSQEETVELNLEDVEAKFIVDVFGQLPNQLKLQGLYENIAEQYNENMPQPVASEEPLISDAVVEN